MRSAGGPDTSGAVSAFLELQYRELLEVYKRDAPLLLKELAVFLSQHQGKFPLGIVNILDCSWEDLTTGAVVRRSAAQPLKPAEVRGAPRAVAAATVRKSPFQSDILRKHVFIQGNRMASIYSESYNCVHQKGNISPCLFSFQNRPNVQPSPCCTAAKCKQVMELKCGGDDDECAASVSLCFSLMVPVFQVGLSSLSLMSPTGSVCVGGRWSLCRSHKIPRG